MKGEWCITHNAAMVTDVTCGVEEHYGLTRTNCVVHYDKLLAETAVPIIKLDAAGFRWKKWLKQNTPKRVKIVVAVQDEDSTYRNFGLEDLENREKTNFNVGVASGIIFATAVIFSTWIIMKTLKPGSNFNVGLFFGGLTIAVRILWKERFLWVPGMKKR